MKLDKAYKQMLVQEYQVKHPGKKIVVNARDVMKDRIISYAEFCQAMAFMRTRHFKYYILMGFLAITGCRPCEARLMRLDTHFDFSDPQDPRVLVPIRKEKEKIVECTRGDYVSINAKYVWRPIPLWFAADLAWYLKETRCSGSMYLFPTSEGTMQGMTAASITTQIAKMRKIMHKHDPEAFAWTKEPYKIDHFRRGRQRICFRFSAYAFRKMHAVLYMKMNQERGDVNAIVATSRHMGHSDIKTTLKYLPLAIDDRENIERHGFMNIAPDAWAAGARQDLRQEILQLRAELAEIRQQIGKT